MPSSRGIPNPGTEPRSLISAALAGRFFATSATWEANLVPITNFYLRFILFIYLNKVIKAIQNFPPRMFVCVCVCVCVCVHLCVVRDICVCVKERLGVGDRLKANSKNSVIYAIACCGASCW